MSSTSNCKLSATVRRRKSSGVRSLSAVGLAAFIAIIAAGAARFLCRTTSGLATEARHKTPPEVPSLCM